MTTTTLDDATMVATPAPTLTAAIDQAGRKVAPLWPLNHFVAVNPYFGLADQTFTDGAIAMARAAGARTTMPRAFYAEAIASGRITDADLEDALAEAPAAGELPADAAALKVAVGESATQVPLDPTVADVAAEVTRRDWPRFVTEQVSFWAAGHFDQGLASWPAPGQGLDPFAAWRAEAALDRSPEIMGVKGFRAFVASLPEDWRAAAGELMAELAVPAAGVDAYLHRLAMSVAGWAAFARWRVWESELYGGTDDTLSAFVVVRLAWDAALLRAFGANGVSDAWARAKPRLAEPAPADARAATALDVVLQAALEKAWQRELVATFAEPRPAGPASRKAIQAAFCIDVRSEVFRRALESVDGDVETIGFAGFFGFPIEYVPLGQTHGGAQCPVLLTPKYTVREQVKGASEPEETEVLGVRMLRRRAHKAWKAFKREAVASFAFVETIGLGFGVKLVTDSLGLTRTVAHPSADGLDKAVVDRLGPELDRREYGGRVVGFPPADRLAMAEAVLDAMSMTETFARLVVLAGHGSTTVNNPHATGLDCGACGGHTGEANARVAALILNDPDVRTGLRAKGIAIPDDTVFVGALHDTTTDEVELYDTEPLPKSHKGDLERLEHLLEAAGKRARAERAALLHLPAGTPVDRGVVARAHDWSQVRPEWGLAGCAAFIAAPRAKSRGRGLAGRAFLHSYDWRTDQGFGVLELIMTAPMVVASWISLQYYGSTVDNRVFGSGNKVLHNVVGNLGVFEGNAGDLRQGLPWQSVHDGERLIHEPLRLSVVIAAPIEAMNAIIEKHAMVRQLVDHRWLHLFAMDDDGVITHRYGGELAWNRLGAGGDSAQIEAA
ncbi:MAG: YbcC family protein [Alphaproteobacteria bacterium]